MRKKVLVVSIFVAVLMVLLPISAVVGTNIVKSDVEKRSIASPLFAVRTQRSLNKEEIKKINSNYLGKGKQLNILLPEKPMAQIWIDKAIKLFDTNPVLFDKLLERLDKIPNIAKMLEKHDVSKQDIKNYMRIIKNNPSELVEEIGDSQITMPFNNIPQPLGLETGNLGCIIIPIVLAPIAAVLTLLILFFTLRILTCMNVNDCGDEILQGIWEQLLQGLTEG